MGTLLIVKLGCTYPWLSKQIGDFDDWISQGVQSRGEGTLVVSPPSGQPLPPAGGIDAVILTGSHSMVTARESWSEATAVWVLEVLRLRKPILGICYGHQLLAWATGGVVGYNPQGGEFGNTEVHLHPEAEEDPIFKGLPSPLPVQVCHAQSVLELPEGALLLASNDHDPHHAFRIGDNAWGVQFHPEFSPAATKAYIEQEADQLRAEGRDPESLLRAVRSTPEANSILARFAKLFCGSSAVDH